MVRPFLFALALSAGINAHPALPKVALGNIGEVAPPIDPTSDANFPKLYNGIAPAAKREWEDVRRDLKKVRKPVKEAMVFHRGFHSFAEVPDLPSVPTWTEEGGPLTRPIENTIASFEAAWEMGANLCECDIALTTDKRLVMFHDDTFWRFDSKREGETVSDHEVSIADEDLKAVQDKDLIAPNAFVQQQHDGQEKEWLQIPLMTDVLKAAEKSGPNKKLVVEIKASNVEVAKETGAAIAEWAKNNVELAKHIAVIMSFADNALLGYHDAGGPHGPSDDIPTLMLLTVKKEGADALHKETPINCDDGKKWSGVKGWNKPAHLDGYYVEVSMKDQLRWIEQVKNKCENELDIVLGAWTYPSDQNALHHEGKVSDADSEQTCAAADVEQSVFFLVDRMGFKYANTDFPNNFFSEGFKTFMKNPNEPQIKIEDFNMLWPKPLPSSAKESGVSFWLLSLVAIGIICGPIVAFVMGRKRNSRRQPLVTQSGLEMVERL